MPDPGTNEVQVTGGACGICSWDLATAKMGSQMYPMAPPGHEGVGYVSKVGAEVAGVKEGDRVAGGGLRLCETYPRNDYTKSQNPKSLMNTGLWNLFLVRLRESITVRLKAEIGLRSSDVGSWAC